jgi:hypothetical protein
MTWKDYHATFIDLERTAIYSFLRGGFVNSILIQQGEEFSCTYDQRGLEV